jgi:cbb3-type cytochrome oxidase maturation protein
MTILLVLIPLGVVLLCVAVAAFVWAVRNGQLEDLEGEAERILFDDEPLAEPRPRGSRDSLEGRK